MTLKEKLIRWEHRVGMICCLPLAILIGITWGIISGLLQAAEIVVERFRYHWNRP